jgi:hypothetical protein
VHVFRLALLLLLCFFLGGCADHQETPAQEAAAEAATAAQDDAQCRSLGLQPNTPPYYQCLNKLADQRAAAENNERAAIAARLQGRSPMSN